MLFVSVARNLHQRRSPNKPSATKRSISTEKTAEENKETKVSLLATVSRRNNNSYSESASKSKMSSMEF